MRAIEDGTFVDKAGLSVALASGDNAELARYLLAIANIALARESLHAPDRDDLRQELVIYMLGKVGRVRPSPTALAYLLTVARRRMFKLRLRARAKQEHRRTWEREKRIHLAIDSRARAI